MSEQEIELFRSMLEMFGEAGEVSVWLLVSWWGVGIFKLVFVTTGLLWAGYAAVNKICNMVLLVAGVEINE